MNKNLLLLTSLVSLTFQNAYSQGCLMNNYDTFNKVFITPTASGARTFVPGNGNNYVRWEGTCGPHTYVEVRGVADGNCTVTEGSVTKTGNYYATVSQPFTRTCNVPLDDHMIWLILMIMPASYLYLKKKLRIKPSFFFREY